ncbi:MAG: hypothetical protein ACYDHD_08425 [Vulcanimicrobiaceae bacterium]
MIASHTLRLAAPLDPGCRSDCEAFARAAQGRLRWLVHDDLGRAYALLETDVARTQWGAEVPRGVVLYPGAIIALAIYPQPAEALQNLQTALGGPGRPSGILESVLTDRALLLEWDPTVTGTLLIWAVVDAELRRYGNCSRRCRLLAPLPEGLLAKIAAAGLQTPEIACDRILESLIEAHHVDV